MFLEEFTILILIEESDIVGEADMQAAGTVLVPGIDNIGAKRKKIIWMTRTSGVVVVHDCPPYALSLQMLQKYLTLCAKSKILYHIQAGSSNYRNSDKCRKGIVLLGSFKFSTEK